MKWCLNKQVWVLLHLFTKITSQEVNAFHPLPCTVAGCDVNCVAGIIMESNVSTEGRRSSVLQRT